MQFIIYLTSFARKYSPCSPRAAPKTSRRFFGSLCNSKIVSFLFPVVPIDADEVEAEAELDEVSVFEESCKDIT